MMIAISSINGYTISLDKILINTIIGNNDLSEGFQFIMQYKNNNDNYVIVVGQAIGDDFTKFKRIAGLTLNIFYISNWNIIY